MHKLIAEEKGESNAADAIRDKMDVAWCKLDEIEIDRVRGLSADFYPHSTDQKDMKARLRPNLEQYAMIMAKAASTRSEDPYVQTGACAIRFNKTVAAVGYNGPPAGSEINWSGRDSRRKRVIHAETNCLRYCTPGEIFLLAVTISPCSRCLDEIAAYGIKTVVYGKVYTRDLGAFELAKEFGISMQLVKLPPWTDRILHLFSK